MKFLVLFLAVAIGLLRPVIEPLVSPLGMQIYKDVAHLYMGALLVLWLLSWRDRRALWCLVFWLLNVIEVVCAVAGRLHP